MSDPWSRADQKLSNIVIGKTYTLSFDALAAPDGATVEIGTSEGDDDVLVITTDDFPNAKSYSDTFIAPSEDLWIGLWVNQNPPVTALFDNISVAEYPPLVNEPPNRTVFIEAQEELGVDGIPTQTLLDSAREYITHDPIDGMDRQPLGLTDDTLHVEPITRQGFYVEVRSLLISTANEAAAKLQIVDELTVYFKNILPFIDGIDVEIDRADTISTLSVSIIVQEVLKQHGGTASGIGLGIQPGQYLNEYTLQSGQMAKLLAVNYV